MVMRIKGRANTEYIPLLMSDLTVCCFAVLLEEPSKVFSISPGFSGAGDVFGIGEFHVGAVRAEFGENPVGEAAGF